MKPYPNIRDLERLSGITWHDLAELEPRLGELLYGARQACVTCRRWSDVDRVFAPVRNTLAELVGFAGEHHEHPVLGGPDAYQVACWKLYDAVAGLLPVPAAGAEGSLETQRGEIVAETCPAESAATAPHGLDCPANGCLPSIVSSASRRGSSGRAKEPHKGGKFRQETGKEPPYHSP